MNLGNRMANGSAPGYRGQVPSENGVIPVVFSESAPSPDADGTVQIKPAHLWGAFRRRWLLAITLGILFAIPAAYLAWKFTPTPFRAQAVIRVRTSRPRVMFSTEEDRIAFNVLKQNAMKELTHRDTITFALSMECAHSETGISKLPMFQHLDPDVDPVEWIRDNVEVGSSGTEFITVAIEGDYPEALAELVNALVNASIKRSSDNFNSDTNKRNERLKKEKVDLETVIIGKETAIDEDIKRNALQNENEQKIELMASIWGGVKSELVAVELELIRKESQRTFIKSLAGPTANVDKGDPFNEDNTTLSDETITRMIESSESYLRGKSWVEDIESRLVKSHKQLTENHPTIKLLENELQKAREELNDVKRLLRKSILEGPNEQLADESARTVRELEFEIEGLKQQRLILRDKEKEDRAQKAENRLAEESLKRAQREVDQLNDLRDGILTRIQTNDVELNSGEQILPDEAAKVPTRRETKKRTLYTAGGGIASFGFVVVCVVLLEMRFMRIGSLKQLEQEFRIPVLGTIPNLPARFMGMQDTTGKAAYYKHAFTESIDTTRTMLLNQQKARPDQKIIMVASALGGEGKSTLSCHLAISFARGGRRTLLVDGDLRSPRIHEVFQVNDFPGLCEALRDETPVEKCIVPTAIPGLSLLPAGELDHLTLQLLAEDRVATILEQLRPQYDVIVFDSAPFLPVTDSLLLLQSVDGVVLSIRKDVTRISKVAAALSKIEMLGGNLLGAVVIGIDEADYGYRSKYIRNYRKDVSRRNEPEIVEATA